MAEKGTDELNTATIQLNELICSSTNIEHHLCEFILSGRREITILLSGKTGTGKSHLTNALIGEHLAEEGEELDPQTDDVTPYDFTKNNVKITVFDTPGLADGIGNDERYLRQILRKVKTVDLFLFCTDMTSKRFSDDDARTIRKLTETFGPSLWDHALVVLTFANQVHLNAKEKDHTFVDLVQQQISLFQKKIRDFQKKIQDFLLSRGVHQEAVSNLPFVPAGELTKPRLPDRDNWLTALWIAAFKRIKRNAKGDFLLANFDRISISYGDLLSESRAETDRPRGVGDDVKSKFNRLSVSELETERHVYSPHECLIQCSPPPAYDEVVTENPVPLPMDESSSQELLKEMVREAIGSQQTREFVEAFASQSGFSRIYAAFFAKIVEFIKKLLRGKKRTEAMRQKEDASKF